MKPIKITRTADRAYTIEVNGVPLVRDTNSLNFDRIKAGLKGGKGWKAPAPDALPHRFDSKRAAESTAHSIGRYILGLGDMVFAYVEHVDGRQAPPLETFGYTDCACRDCFEIAIGKAGVAFCSDCTDAECSLEHECQRPDAYGADAAE